MIKMYVKRSGLENYFPYWKMTKFFPRHFHCVGILLIGLGASVTSSKKEIIPNTLTASKW